MDKARSWVLVIGILLIVGLAAYGVLLVVRQTVQSVTDPVNNLAGSLDEQMGQVLGLGTQVAEALNPTPTVLPDPVTIVHDVRSLARLETIQYTLEKVIRVESGQGPFGFLFGDKLLFVAHGQVIAGVDLDKLQPEDLWVENGVLYVNLPPPEVFVATLDNEKSYVYDRETGALTHGDVNLETTARQAAEQEILEAALEDGILAQAEINAENFLFRLLRDLGYPELIFVEGTPEP